MNFPEYGRSQRRTRAPGFETGTVKKVGDKWIGYYHAYVLDPVTGGKKRVGRHKLLGLCAQMTKTEAKKALAEFLRERGQAPVETGPATFRTVAEKYIALRQENWSESEQGTARSLFKHILYPALGERPVAQITAEELKLFVDSLPRRRGFKKSAPGISKSYAKKTITHLRAVFGLALDLEPPLVKRNPAASTNVTLRLRIPVKATAADKSILPPRDFLRLLEELEERERLIVWIAMLGGPRPNEIFALRAGHVGMDRVYLEGALDFKRRLKTTKTKKTREVLLPPMVREDLARWIERRHLHPGDLLFQTQRGTPLVRGDVLQRKIRTAARRAGILTQDVDFQMMRRSFATTFAILTGDVKAVQGQLGHSRPDMALNEYIQVNQPHLAAQLARAERVLRGVDSWPEEAWAKVEAKTAREAIQ